MKRGKASGHDQITAEHLKYSGCLVKAIITWAMNSMIYDLFIAMNAINNKDAFLHVANLTIP